MTHTSMLRKTPTDCYGKDTKAVTRGTTTFGFNIAMIKTIRRGSLHSNRANTPGAHPPRIAFY